MSSTQSVVSVSLSGAVHAISTTSTAGRRSSGGFAARARELSTNMSSPAGLSNSADLDSPMLSDGDDTSTSHFSDVSSEDGELGKNDTSRFSRRKSRHAQSQRNTDVQANANDGGSGDEEQREVGEAAGDEPTTQVSKIKDQVQN